MPRTIFFICSGVCLLNATATIAQHLSRNPNPQQIIGFRMQEQQYWNIKQLPKNSVLYKSEKGNLMLFDFGGDNVPIDFMEDFLRNPPSRGDYFSITSIKVESVSGKQYYLKPIKLKIDF